MATLEIIDGSVIQGPPLRLIGHNVLPTVPGTGAAPAATLTDADGNLDAPDVLPAGATTRYESTSRPWAFPDCATVARAC